MRSYSTIGLIAWLVLAQSTRWATPWAGWVSWGMFGCLVVGWLARRKGAALLAVWRSPVLPVAGAAVLSAAVNGGWSRAADWCMYACMWAWMDDERPRLGGAIGTVGKIVIAVSLFEWLYLVRTFGGGRVHALGNPNVIAAMIALALPRLYPHKCGGTRGGTRGGTSRAWVFLAAAAMVATGSLAGLIGLGMYGLAVYKKPGLWIAAAGAAGLALVIRPESAMLRVAFWAQASRLFLAHPLAGVGPGLYQFQGWGHAHNLLMSVLAEMGLTGLAGLGWGARSVVKRMRNPEGYATLLAVVPFFLVDDMTMWWAVMLGVIVAFSEGER